MGTYGCPADGEWTEWNLSSPRPNRLNQAEMWWIGQSDDAGERTIDGYNIALYCNVRRILIARSCECWGKANGLIIRLDEPSIVTL